MIKWREITEAQYIEQLEAVAPATWSGVGFLKGGTPFDWNFDGDPRFVAYARLNGQHYESTEPLTFPHFRATTPQDVLRNVVSDNVQSARTIPFEEGRHTCETNFVLAHLLLLIRYISSATSTTVKPLQPERDR
jgi:hypothetical protein